MPKIIELTVEIDIERVSCPGVWLCQDGRVSLTVFALGTSYQTCLLPPMFPLMFKDIFYFRKRFQETCALNNICCLLKDETIYCELVQWCDDCVSGECVMLAQYLGALNDVLFPPNMCSNDGVDLLMRRSKEFPGILSPKIEIATKVRIDEVWNQPCSGSALKVSPCRCLPRTHDGPKQKPVCHSARYHRHKCPTTTINTRSSRSKSRSDESRSCCSLTPPTTKPCSCQNPVRPRPRSRPRRGSPRAARPCRPPAQSAQPAQPAQSAPPQQQYSVYNARPNSGSPFQAARPTQCAESECDEDADISNKSVNELIEDRLQKIILESRFIEEDKSDTKFIDKQKTAKFQIPPCVCEICRKYHELFHNQVNSRVDKNF